MNDSQSLLGKVAAHWARTPTPKEKALIGWLDHPTLQRLFNARISGDPAVAWFSYVNRKYVPTPLGRALSLGCGEGGLERHAFSLGTVDRFDAIDISPGALKKARSAADSAGVLHRVDYMVADLNHLALPPQAYGAVFASMSIHHVEALEDLCEQVCRSLREGGYLICNEYVGPSRFQFPVHQLRIINDLLAILPPNYRRIIQHGMPTSRLKTSYQNPDLTWFTQNDPSEAVRSAEILGVFDRFFRIVEYKPYGGGILHMLLADIVGNFRPGCDEHEAWLSMLAYTERLLEETGTIGSDFALIVATPKSPLST